MTTVNTKGYVLDESGQWWKLFKDGRKTRARVETCEQCGDDYPNWKEPRQFCSVKCRGLSRRVTTPIGKCGYCEKEFEIRQRGQVFCSHTCAATSMHSDRPVTTVDVPHWQVKNSDDPRWFPDERGQWWYRASNGQRVRGHVGKCPVCDSDYLFTVFTKKNRTCSHSCGMTLFHRENPGATAGSKSVHWKGGEILRRGYMLIYAPEHPSVQGTTRKYVLKHRLVMEDILGRLMLPTEQVHHKNGDRADNRPENLELWALQQPAGQRSTEQKHCPTCTCGVKH